MRNSVKTYLGIRFLAVVAIVCITAASAIAQDVNQPAIEDVNKPTIEDVNRLTAEDVNKPAEEISFEQRMQKTVTITMSDADIRKVVEAVADQAGVDVVISPEVKGNVTVKLTNVPLEEALRNILAAHGFSYVATENMIRVEKGADRTKGVEPTEPLQTKTYEIVYADVVEVVKALDKFKSKQGMATSIKGTSYIIVTDTESKIRDITAFIEKIDKMTPQILVEARIYDITSKDSFDIGTDWHVGRNTPITEISETDTKTRSNKSSSKTGSKTTVTGEAKTTSKRTDTTTGPTDTYETTITETVDTVDPTNSGTVTVTKTTQKPATTGYGITDTAELNSSGKTEGTVEDSDENTRDNTNEISKDKSRTWLRDFYGKSSPFMGGGFDTEEGGTIRFGVLNDAVDIEMALSILHKQVGAKLLANPRVLVLDNETAKINIISEIPYQRLTESAMGGSIGTTEFKEVGVKLEVTPHLAERDQMIRLQLKPEFSVKTDEVKLQTTGGGLQYSQPVVDKRTADTILLIKNGQTVVLGGLRKKETTQDIRKVPLLGDLPLFGNLFRSESEDTVNSEMVVFITVWIIKQPVMSQQEQDAFKATEFPGPKQDLTRAEKHQEQQQDSAPGTD